MLQRAARLLTLCGTLPITVKPVGLKLWLADSDIAVAGVWGPDTISEGFWLTNSRVGLAEDRRFWGSLNVLAPRAELYAIVAPILHTDSG